MHPSQQIPDPSLSLAATRLTFDRGTLVLRASDKSKLGRAPGEFWTFDGRIAAWRSLAMHYAEARRRLREKLGDDLCDEVRAPPRVAWPGCNLPALRPDQKDAVDAWETAGGRGVIVMPTGTGKTEVALAAMWRMRIATLVVAPVRDLMHQWHQRIFQRLGYDAGIVGDSSFNLQPVTVTTYDSAYARMPEMGDRFGLIIFDEAHHLPGRSYREAAMFSTAPLRLGLTATPERFDGREEDFPELLGPIVYRQEISSARGKTLAEYHVVRIPVRLSEQEQYAYDKAGKVVRGFLAARREEGGGAYKWRDLCADTGKDPAARQAQRAFNARRAIEDRAQEKLDVLEDLFRVHAGERVIVFAGSNLMAMEVSRRFLLPTILSHSRKKERREVLTGFAEGRFPAIVANQVLDEGVDVPAAKVAVVIGGHASTRQAKQRLGRILRRTGNIRATLYEVVCQETNDEERSRSRRRSDAFDRVRRCMPKHK